MQAPRLSASFAEDNANYPTPWGFNGMGEMVYARTYFRNKEDGIKEIWPETIVRAVNGAQDLCEAVGGPLTEEELYRLAQYMLDLKGTVSGRGLWQLGTPLVSELGTASLFNCQVLPSTDFPAIMEFLMLGCGIGYSLERSEIYEFPRIKQLDREIRHERSPDADHIVPDKREGWAGLLAKVVEAYTVTGKGFSYSTLLLRSAGAKLSRFGGTSSGPEILIEGIGNIIRIFESRVGRKLRSVDVGDIDTIIGAIVKAGNARRSAQLALGDPDDHLYSKFKNWNAGNIPSWRGNANISIIADDFSEIPAWYWKSGWEGDGEVHGLLNRNLARTQGRTGEKRPDPRVIATNPCLVGDTWVMTADGPRQIHDLLDNPWSKGFVAVVDGQDHKATSFWSSGIQDVVRIETSAGHVLRLTSEHKIMTDSGEWIEAGQSLGQKIRLNDHQGILWDGPGTDGDGYLIGQLIGDGTFGNQAEIHSWDFENDPLDKIETLMRDLPHRSDWGGWRDATSHPKKLIASVGLTELAASWGIVRGHKTITSQIERGSSDFYVGIIRGLFDTDGHVEGSSTGSGVSIRLSQSDLPMLQAVQRMLGRLGIQSTIRSGRPAGFKTMPGGTYPVKESFRLIVTGENAQKFMAKIGFWNKAKMKAWDDRTAGMKRGFYTKSCASEVISVMSDGTEEVFDCSVNDVHAFDANGIYVSNCGEIFLENYETCNLSTLFLPNIRTYEELVDISTILYKIQKATALYGHHDPRVDAVMKRNMRLGQSVCGLAQVDEEQWGWLEDGYTALRETDVRWSKELGVKPSIRLTTLQPGGTIPLGPGILSGSKAAQARHYVRRVRLASDDPLAEVARQRGYVVHPYDINIDGSFDHTKAVVDFPVETPENVPLISDVTAIDQLESVKRIQRVWSDNSVSVTVDFQDGEQADIKAWLAENYETGIKSVSFLRHEDHGFPLPPYETIDETTYRDLVGRLDLSVPLRDTGSDLTFDDCAGGSCPIR